jgi:hypothetical protein
MDNNSFNSRLSKPTNIYHEEVIEQPKAEESITEVVVPEVVVPEEVKVDEEVKVENIVPPKEKKISPSQIRFNPTPKEYKPKKKSLLKIALMGFAGQEMDASEQRKFDNVVVNDGRALLFCIIFAFCAFYVITNTDIGSTSYKEGIERKDDLFNRTVNYFVNKYKNKQNNTNTVVVDTIKNQTPLVEQPIVAIDTLIDDTRDASKGFEKEIENQHVVEQPKPEPIVEAKQEPKPVVIEQPKSFNKDNLSRYYDSVLKSKHH